MSAIPAHSEAPDAIVKPGIEPGPSPDTANRMTRFQQLSLSHSCRAPKIRKWTATDVLR
jgi:hypothetical protein